MAATSSLDHLSNRMKLEWHSKLNTEMVPAKNFRRTSIIGTIGMSCPTTVEVFLTSSPVSLENGAWSLDE
jgi:pyruvate kinase